MNSVDNVLERIIQYQQDTGSGPADGGKIGCSRPLYQRTRTGRIPPGGTFLKGHEAAGAVVRGNRRAAVRARQRTKLTWN
jgi:hypothetical protein